MPIKTKQEREPAPKQPRLRWANVEIILVVILSNVLLQAFQNQLNMRLVINFIFAWHTVKFSLSCIVLALPALFVWGVTNRLRLTSVLLLATSLLAGVATYEKMRQRGEPLYPSDLSMVSEIPFLLKMLTPPMAIGIVAALIGFILLLVWMVRRDRFRPTYRLSLPARVGIVFVTTFGMLYVGMFQEEGNLLKKAYDQSAHWISYSQRMNYYNNGFVAGFLYNFPSAPMREPAGYEEEEFLALLAKYEEKAKEINQKRTNDAVSTNVIFIMNESFTNPRWLKEANQELTPIAFTEWLMQTQGGGRMISQGYGGGTANMEYEALTGFSMEPFAPNITTPYTQMLPKMDSFPSVVERLKAEGHTATAIHPYDTSMYKRRDNYEMFGFDAFYYDSTMKHTERLDRNPYISDAAAYEEVLYRMKESEGYDFIHLVTMQNHTPFANKYTNPVSAQESGFLNQSINQFYTDLYYSDLALEELYHTLASFEEPTIVVMWGDHWPNVFGEDIYENNGPEVMHQTPVVMFKNDATNRKDFGVTSPIYFYTEVLALTDSAVSPFDALLMELQKEVPAFEKGMYLKEGKLVESREELSTKAQQLLAEYDLILYDVTTGKQLSRERSFFQKAQ